MVIEIFWAHALLFKLELCSQDVGVLDATGGGGGIYAVGCPLLKSIIITGNVCACVRLKPGNFIIYYVDSVANKFLIKIQ